jgi:hypothetical protein
MAAIRAFVDDSLSSDHHAVGWQDRDSTSCVSDA